MITNYIKKHFSYLHKANKIITDGIVNNLVNPQILNHKSKDISVNYNITKLSDIPLNKSFNILSYNIDKNKFEFNEAYLTYHNNIELDDITLTNNSNLFINHKLLLLNDKLKYIENDKLSYDDKFLCFTLFYNEFKIYNNKYISNRCYHSNKESIKINTNNNYCLIYSYNHNMISGIIVKNK